MFSSNNTPAEEMVFCPSKERLSTWCLRRCSLLQSVATLPEIISAAIIQEGCLNWERISWTILKRLSSAWPRSNWSKHLRSWKDLESNDLDPCPLSSNTVSNDYYPELAKQLFQLAEVAEKTGGYLTLSTSLVGLEELQTRRPTKWYCCDWGKVFCRLMRTF